MMNGMMDSMGSCGGSMMTMMGIFWLLLVVLIGLGIVYLARALNLGQTFKTADSTPLNEDKVLDFARERYAKGEIDKDEFERLKHAQS